MNLSASQRGNRYPSGGKLMLECVEVLPLETETHTYGAYGAEVAERIIGMLSVEKVYMAHPDYVTATQYARMSVRCRGEIASWMSQVAEDLGYVKDTTAAALNFFDRFMSLDTNYSSIHVVAVTALFLASKCFETCPISLSQAVSVGEGAFNTEDLEVMELHMLKTLGWRVHPPGVYELLHLFTRLLSQQITPPDWVANADRSTFAEMMVDHAVYQYDFIKYAPSQIAVAALMTSCDCVMAPHHDVVDALARIGVNIGENTFACRAQILQDVGIAGLSPTGPVMSVKPPSPEVEVGLGEEVMVSKQRCETPPGVDELLLDISTVGDDDEQDDPDMPDSFVPITERGVERDTGRSTPSLEFGIGNQELVRPTVNFSPPLSSSMPTTQYPSFISLATGTSASAPIARAMSGNDNKRLLYSSDFLDMDQPPIKRRRSVC